MANLPPPNNDLNVLEDKHAPAPEHAPIAPNPAPIQPNDYLADDEEEEPISEQAPTALVVPIGHNDPRDSYVVPRIFDGNARLAVGGFDVGLKRWMRPWTEVKQMLIDKFCPIEEVQRPTTLNEAVRMAHALMEQKIQAKDERIAKGLKRKWESNNQGGSNYRNNNRGNYRENDRHNQYNDRIQGGARAMTTAQNDDADQGELAPNCNRCGLCHLGQCPSKCNRCRRRGHKSL
ncbi:hypothetical protein Tco_0195830 [Tanacetum coccineum]